MSGRVSSFPFIMFPDDKVKVLRIILRGFFIAEGVDGPFYMKRDNHWMSVSKSMWYAEINIHIISCCKSNDMKSVDKKTIAKAISFLYNENAHKRVFKSSEKYPDKLATSLIFRVNTPIRRVSAI